MPDYDPFAGAQAAAEFRLAAAYASMYADDGDEDEGELSPEIQMEMQLLSGPFCGCETCVVREVLDAAQLHLIKTIRPEDLARMQDREYPSEQDD